MQMDTELSALNRYAKVQTFRSIFHPYCSPRNTPSELFAVGLPLNSVVDNIFVGYLHDVALDLHNVPPTATASLSQLVRSAIAVCLRTHNPPSQTWMKPSNVLARGFRLDTASATGLRQTHENAQADLLHCKDVHDFIFDASEPGFRSIFFALLTDMNIALFLGLLNGCFVQLSGLALDDIAKVSLRALTSPPVPVLATWNLSDIVAHAGWELPRSHIRLPGTHKGDANSDAHLRYCVPLYHCKTFARNPGLPRTHVLNVLSMPAADLVEAANGETGGIVEISSIQQLHLLASRYQRICMPQVHPDMASAAPSIQSLTGASQSAVFSVKSCNTLRALARGHAAVQIQGVANNDARRLMHHIFVHRPHLVDLAAFNASLPASAIRALTQCCHQSGKVLSAKCRCTSAMCAETALPGSLNGGISVFRELLARHAACSYANLLSAFCPITPIIGPNNGTHPSDLRGRKCGRVNRDPCSFASPLAADTPVESVFRFTRAVLRKIIPSCLWGGSAAHRHILSSVFRWLCMGKNDQLKLGELTTGLPTDGFPFGDKATRISLVHSWVAWVLLGIVSPLIRAHFYITYSESTAHRTLFFRKPTWAFLTKHALGLLKEKLQLVAMDAKAVVTELKARSRAQLGFATVRLSVKPTGMRPIMNLAAQQVIHVRAGRSVMESIKYKSINSVLTTLHDCLVAQHKLQPHLSGSSIFSVQGVHAALVKFIDRANAASDVPRPQVHMVSCDIQAAFDSIQQRLATDIACKLLPEAVPSFAIRRYASIRPVHNQASSCGVKAPSAGVRIRWHRVANPAGHVQSFVHFCSDMSSRMRNAVFVDNVEYQLANRKQLLQQLNTHLNAHIVQLPTGFFARQGSGIPQGSILSTMICNLYIGNLEKHVLIPGMGKWLQQQPQPETGCSLPSLLMRLTDDFLFITFDKRMAVAFASTMHGAFHDHKLVINPAKTKSTFAIPHVNVFTASAQIAWCGLLFDSKDGRIAADHSRLLGPGRLRASMSMLSLAAPAVAFAKFVRSTLKPKCQPILLDGRLNSVAAVALNVFQLCLTSAAKFICMAAEGKRRWKQQSARRDVKDDMVTVMMRAVELSVHQLRMLIRNRCKGGVGISPDAPMSTSSPPHSPAPESAIPLLNGFRHSIHLGGTDEIRLTMHNEKCFTTVHSLRNPGERPALHSAVCPLYDVEIHWLAYRAWQMCLEQRKNEFLQLYHFCAAKCDSFRRCRRGACIRAEVLAATNSSQSTMLYKLDY